MARTPPHGATLTIHGAAGEVTGSCHLLEANGVRILVDCGMFQGSDDLEHDNEQPFGFDPAAIDVLVLTHAHLDHCGRIPLLVKRGFRGEIVATSATRELAELVLLDAAKLQEEDAERDARKARREGREPKEPLYTTADAAWAMGFFGRNATYGEAIRIGPGIDATFLDAGHILGSATVVVDVTTGDEVRRITFSGDIGNHGRPIMRDPTPPPPSDYVVMESTYGDRRHKSVQASVTELYEAIDDTLRRGGNVIIPTFALERAQEVLYFIREACEDGRLPRAMPVYLDSPMAISATEIYLHHPEAVDPDTYRQLQKGDDPFRPPGLQMTRDVQASMQINHVHGGAVILAGSGMATGGRVKHHLKHNLWREECSVVFVGYAAKGTPARAIIDGADEIRLFGEEIKVRARIYTINGFSAHADHDELIEWVSHAGTPREVFLVHGERHRGMDALAHDLRAKGYRVGEPKAHHPYRLT